MERFELGMKATMKLLLAALLGISMSFASVIDDYSVSQGLVTDSIADAAAVSDTLGNRTIWTNKTGGLAATSIGVNGGFYLGNIDAFTSGESGVIYTGLWDLTADEAKALTLDVVSVESYTTGVITFFVTEGVNTATYAMGVPSTGTILAHLASFTGIGLVDRSIVDKLGFTFSHVTQQDIVLDNFGTYVPEPGTYGLMALGLFGLAFARRRKVS